MASISLRTRIIIILYIISFTVSLFIFTAVMNSQSIHIECTSYSQYEVEGSDIYFSQNTGDRGLLFKMNSQGEVSRIFTSAETTDKRIIGVSVYEGKVYLVLEGFVEEEDTEEGIKSTPTYTIVCLDNKLNLETRTPRFVLTEDEYLGGFSAEGTGLFMTMIAKDGSYVRVYSVGHETLKTPEELKEDDDVKIEAVRSKKSTDRRFYSDAYYEAGQLYLRTDSDAASGVFAVDGYIANLVTNMKLTVGQLLSLYSFYIICYVAALLIWFILLYLLIRLFEHRNRSFYYIVIAEVVLFIIVGVGVAVVADEHYSAREAEHTRFAIISLIGLSDDAGMHESVDYTDETFYDSDRYQQIKNSLCEFVKREGNSDIFYDVFVYRLRDNFICASASGRNRQSVGEVYGRSLTGLSDSIFKGSKYAFEDFSIEGQDYRAVAVTVGQGTPDYALVGIINDTSTDASVFVEDGSTLLFFLMIFAFASAAVVAVWYLHMRDLTELEKALSSTALGGELPPRPITIGWDVKDMWDSVTEINKRVEEIEYSKIRMLEAYYRFAPKNVEKVLGKKSIIEVKNGDSCTLSGTLGLMGMNFTDTARIKYFDRIIGSIGTYQKEHDSIIIGKAPDLSGVELFFLETEKTTVKSFTDLFNTNVKNGSAVGLSTILYFDKCTFGVIGNDDETTTYISAEKQKLIAGISSFITSVKLGLVITDEVKDRENIEGALRFIGNAGKDSNGNFIRLYEVLDAYPARIRSERLATLAKYNEALDLFYEKDFYIARTKFSDILKETPEDNLVKWYVFESDRYLNESTEGDDYKLLHV